MLKANVQDALNAQINAELASAYLYLAMAAHFHAGDLPGCASWMRGQAHEEAVHALKLYDHVNERGGRVVLEALGRPPVDFGNPLETFRQVLAHEQHVTALIHDLYRLAQREDDHATAIMLQWFITEQVEEESTAEGIVAQLAMVGDHPASLLMVDRQLAARGA